MKKSIAVLVISLWSSIQATSQDTVIIPSNEVMLYSRSTKNCAIGIPKEVITNFFKLITFFSPHDVAANTVIIPETISFPLPYHEVEKLAQFLTILYDFNFAEVDDGYSRHQLLDLCANVSRDKFYLMIMKALRLCYKEEVCALLRNEERRVLLSQEFMFQLTNMHPIEAIAGIRSPTALQLLYGAAGAFLIMEILRQDFKLDITTISEALFMLIVAVYYYTQEAPHWTDYRESLKKENLILPAV